MGKGGVSRAQRGRSPQSRARASPIARDGPAIARDRPQASRLGTQQLRPSLTPLSLYFSQTLSLYIVITHTHRSPPLIHFSAHQGSAMYEHGSETLVPGHGSQEVLHKDTAAASVVNKFILTHDDIGAACAQRDSRPPSSRRAARPYTARC
jgi:hypothetical protein